MAIKIISNPISKNELQKIAENQFGDLVKAVIEQEALKVWGFKEKLEI